MGLRLLSLAALVLPLLVVPLLVVPLLAAPAAASGLPHPGQVAVGRIALLDKQVPLPPGKWQVASAGYGQIAGDDLGPYGAIGGILLLRQGADASGEFLLIHTNALPLRAGWGQPFECVSEDALLRSTTESRNLHNACSFVVALRRTQLLRSHLPALGDPQATAGLAAALPSWALIAGFRVSDRQDVLDVRYGSAPAQPDPSIWFQYDAKVDHAHREELTRLGDWAQTARVVGIAALRDPLDQVASIPALPGLDDTTTARRPPEEQISTLRLSLYKLASYKVPSLAFSYAVSTLVAGNFYTGAMVTFWQQLTHTGVYLGNELTWEWPPAIPVAPFVAAPRTTAPGTAMHDAPGGRPHAARAENPVVLAATGGQAIPGMPASSGFFSVDGKQVPLPPGRWAPLVSTTESGVTATILTQVRNATLAGLVVIHTNAAKTAAILGPSPECGRRDLGFAVTRYDTPEDGFCAYGKRVIPLHDAQQAMRDNGLWARALERLSADGVAVPRLLVLIGARARTQSNFIDARYYFVPPPGLGDPAPDAAPPVLVRAMQAWADLMQSPLELGARGRLAPLETQIPSPWDANAVNVARITQTQLPLEQLAVSGAIGAAALGRQLAQADAAMAEPEVQQLSLWSRSFLKVVTYRISSSLDTFATQAIVTGSPGQGVAVASIHAVFKPLLAYGNEIYWAHSGVGKAPAALLSASFPDIGQ